MADQRADLEVSRRWLADEHELLSAHEDIADEFEVEIVAKRGEEVLLVIKGAGLIESRSPGATYRGTSMGASIRVAKGVYLRPGRHGGQIERPLEELKMIDQGVFTITSLRCLFAGSRQTRTWDYSKLVSVNYSTSYEGQPAILMPVENRQKTSGVVLDERGLQFVQSRLGFATALYSGREDRYLAELADDIAALDAEIAQLSGG